MQTPHEIRLALVAARPVTARQGIGSLTLALTLLLCHPGKSRAEDHIDYRYAYYKEDHGRVRILTHSALFEAALANWVSLKAEAVYDAISGASPIGAPPTDTITYAAGPFGPVSSGVPVSPLRDIRRAGNLEPTFTLGNHRFRPQVSYSGEGDYVSRGLAFNYSLDFNEKNSTLNLGVAHTWDRILPRNSPYLKFNENKVSDDFMVGLNQLLGPKTLLTVNLTLGRSRGYMNDPYKAVLFEDFPEFFPDTLTLFGERRPRLRQKQIGYVALTQYVDRLNASAEGSYRFYRDDFGILAHTVETAWHQKLGKHLVLSPSFRFYRQSAADFYGTRFPGDPSLPTGFPLAWGPNPEPPTYYSADYRLSAMDTLTYGIKATFKVQEWLTVDAGYQRYTMSGRDGMTSQTAYPQANVVSVGARLWF
jgi:hypothetical protein